MGDIYASSHTGGYHNPKRDFYYYSTDTTFTWDSHTHTISPGYGGERSHSHGSDRYGPPSSDQLRDMAKRLAELTTTLQKVTKPIQEGNKKVPVQNEIDKEVLEALEKPRKDAEVKRRVELAGKLEPLGERPVGTVIKWTRRYGDDDSASYSYAALKVEMVTGKTKSVKWFVTGENMSGRGMKWKDLLDWMVTGETTVENVEVSLTWESVQ